MDGIDLECVLSEKNLGVKISEDLKRDTQCKEVVSKANKILGMIKQILEIEQKKPTCPYIKV